MLRYTQHDKLTGHAMTKKVLFLVLLLLPLELFAGGISTNYADVFIENLAINTEYKHNLPLKVTNRSNKKIEVTIKVLTPQKDNLKTGAEPIRDTKWIIVTPEKYILEAGQTGLSDVFIKIPKNKKLRGRIFQFNIETCGFPSEKTGRIIVVPSLLSKVRFSVEKKKGFLGLW